MTPVTHACNQTIAVVGLGGSGLVTARALLAGGARVLAWDDSDGQRARALQEGITVVPIAAMPWVKIRSLILAPGIPLTHRDGVKFTHDAVSAARAHQVEVIGDIELFCRERAFLAPDAPLIAITGTNGKSTTTALIAHILRHSGRDVQMGGNIGAAVLSLSPPSVGRIHVVEVSSFQIDLAPRLEPDVGIFLNLTPDHLDRHGTIMDYWGIKHRMMMNSRYAVVGTDDSWGKRTAAAIDAGRLATVSTRESADFEWRNGHILHHQIAVASVADVGSLRGEHNGQNAAAAVAACLRVGCALSEIQAGLQTFPGLAHRMEMVGKRGNVLFVNDSKATNADSTEKALTSFPGDIYWIVGGKAKEGGIEPLAAYFPRVKKAYLIGASREAFANTLEGRVPYVVSDTMDVAIAQAASDAEISAAAEPVVLLSPACASYDQFANFEVRGDYFRKLARAIIDGSSEPMRRD